MNCNGDVANNWKRFHEAYEDYLIAKGLDQKDKKVQVATLKSLMGTECKKMKDPVIILAKLQDHFVQVRNILYERYIFHNTEQQVHETIDQLRQLAEPCNFATLEERRCEETECSKISTSTKKRERSQLKQGGKCRYCGGAHERYKHKRPAFGNSCRKCGKANHFKSVSMQKQGVNLMNVESSDNENSFYVEIVDAIRHVERRRYFVSLSFWDKDGGESQIQCQLDTGATCNVMSFNTLCEIKQSGSPAMQPTCIKIKLYNGSFVPSLGECELNCIYNGESHKLNFNIIKGDQKPLLSGETCTSMGLITVHIANSINTSPITAPSDIFMEYKDVFEGLGCLPGEYHLEIDPDAQPVKHTPRIIGIPLKDELKAHIETLEKMEVLKKVTEPTEWISSQVIVRKGSNLRLCIDPKDLNKALKRSHYPTPTIEEIVPELTKAKVFSVADAKNGFWQVKLDEASSYLTTFWTPFGRYRWLRMPFGIATAPEEYQRRQHEVLEGLPGKQVIADDILITCQRETQEEALRDHDRNLVALLQRAREVNLKLNPKKLKLRFNEVSYIGHLLTPDGVKPDPEKKLVANHPVLCYYDVSKPVSIQRDSSETGLGAAFLQDGQPVAFASRTLKPIVFSCDRFNQYIYGRESVDVQSDHNPLEAMFVKPLTAAPKRPQGMLLRLQKFNLKVCYKKGTEIFIADTLSRAPLPEFGPPGNYLRPEKEDVCRANVEQINASEFIRVLDGGLRSMQRETEADAKLQCLKEIVFWGWPETKPEADPSVAEYWTFRDELIKYL
ncbi:Hypothetical predicted protein [Paramuricea clavata]|uniref:Uncharacterized protein n=1 Tax=Paramuricea clavata TaxID=317549 RepID=A0A7D9I8I4_PARCT|nr:Hypothetical predicted protein [Paramuricea clavata]